MKSFFALALLGALAYADEKADLAGTYNAGTDTPPLTQAIPQPDVTLKTGAAGDKATLKQATGVRTTTGTDAQTYFQYMYEIVPTALYKPSDGKTKLTVAFAADATTEKVDWTQWSVAILGGSTTLVNYNYATIDRSISAIEGTANSLTPTETGVLTSQKFSYTVSEKVLSTQQTSNDNYWDPVTTASKYEASGAQTMVLERKTPGVEQIKVGGATLVWVKYDDADGSQVIGGKFVKFADAEKVESDSAFSVSATAALAVAAIAALF